MRNVLVAFGVLAGAGVFLQCTSVDDMCVGEDCPVYTDGEGGLEAGPCDETLAPTVDDSAVIYVAKSGTAAGTGSKDAPYNSINAALAKIGSGKTSIYVCKGNYNENVVVSDTIQGASIYGGFSCDVGEAGDGGDADDAGEAGKINWKYTCDKPVVKPSANYALRVDKGGVVIKDMHFEAPPGVAKGDSSIAVFANQANVTFTRSELVAGAAIAGKDGDAGKAGVVTADGDLPNSYDGNPASPISGDGGKKKTCTCSTGGTTTGGAGGGVGGGSISPDGANGEATGDTSWPDGSGAGGTRTDCEGSMGGKSGVRSEFIASNGSVASGFLDATGWHRGDGNPGVDGQPGLGGGGGGSFYVAGGTTNGGGGGGACGGCGGGGGKEGGAGGLSVALLSYESMVSLNGCSLSASATGPGGNGGAGYSDVAGLSGGIGGIGNKRGCQGGGGGNGSPGGAGSGGQGGISAAILYTGDKPIPDKSCTLNSAPAGSVSGGAGGASDNAGPPGLAGTVVFVDGTGNLTSP